MRLSPRRQWRHYGCYRPVPKGTLRDGLDQGHELGRDRAGQFTESFDAALASTGIQALKIPPRSPRANAYAERFVLTARTEVTDRMLIFGTRHLRVVMAEYEAHYNRRRPLRSRQLHPPGLTTPPPILSQEQIRRRPVLGGLINEYERAT